MRTKTMVISAMLGALGTASVMAQNVYSLNTVGYVTVTCYPGFNMVTCPLITTPDNTVGTVFNNSTGALTPSQVWFYSPISGYNSNAVNNSGEDVAENIGGRGTTNANGWGEGGTLVLSPGVGCWFNNLTGSNVSFTFVGTVTNGPVTNTLSTGFNLVGSAVPMSGDLVTNGISLLTNYNIGDYIWTFTPSNAVPPGVGYTEYISGTGSRFNGNSNHWANPLGDPFLTNNGEGFWYENNVGTTVQWVENYTTGAP
jgi:hypothetical protein